MHVWCVQTARLYGKAGCKCGQPLCSAVLPDCIRAGQGYVAGQDELFIQMHTQPMLGQHVPEVYCCAALIFIR